MARGGCGPRMNSVICRLRGSRLIEKGAPREMGEGCTGPRKKEARCRAGGASVWKLYLNKLGR